MKEAWEKFVNIFKITIITATTLVFIIVLMPFVITDKDTNDAISQLYYEYSSLYVGGDKLKYAVVMQSAIETANDTIMSYQSKELSNSSKYVTEMEALNKWKELKYNGKDDTLRKVSENMLLISTAPAKAATEMKKLENSMIFNTVVTVRSLAYSLRFEDTVIYIIFCLLVALGEVGLISVLIWLRRINEEESKYDDDENYYEDEEDYCGSKDESNINLDSYKNNRIRMR